MAMAAMTLDHLSGGRFILGLGASGPQVAEGWYGDDYRKPAGPHARVRRHRAAGARARERRSSSTASATSSRNPDGTGFGKPLKSIMHPLRADLPIYLAAEGPKNVAARRRDRRRLAADVLRAALDDGSTATRSPKGFAQPGARRTAGDFEVACMVPVIIADDVEAAADLYRPMLALYIGGMGASEVNFHNDVFVRMGYEDEAKHIQDLYLEGRRKKPPRPVPLQLVQDVALIGPKEKIRDDSRAYGASRPSRR